MSKIQWTERTWNPIVGCSVVSPGCTNCYAMRQAARLLDKPGSHYDGTTQVVNGKAVWTGKVALAPDHILTAPLRRKKPTVYFVNSMGDLFHEDVPDDWIDRVFAVMALCPRHIFQVLTKRGDRMRAYINRQGAGATPDRAWYLFAAIRNFINDEYHENARFIYDETPFPWPLPNVWIGTSIEDRRRGEERAWHLAQTPAAVRFWSIEPLLEDLGNLTTLGLRDMIDGSRRAVDWVIIGGESGPGARPFNIEWARSIIRQCRAAGVPVFVKQLGATPVNYYGHALKLRDRKGGDMTEWPAELRVREMPTRERARA